MKKSILLIISAASMVIAAASCQVKESLETPEQLVPKVFSALDGDAVTKTVLDSDGTTVLWTAGELVKVFDSAAHTFTSTSSGKGTTLTGSVTEGATEFYALSPYQEDATIDGSVISAEIPNIQYAVEGGFDPRAVLSVAYSADGSDAFAFKTVCALLKITIPEDDIVAVEFSTTDANANMTGSVKLTVKTDGSNPSVSNGTGEKCKNVVLRKEDGSALIKDATYYVAVRPTGTSSKYTEFEVKYVRSDDHKVATKSYSSTLEVSRKHIKTVTLPTGLEYKTDKYGVYEAGFPISVGSVTISKSECGPAKLLTAPNDTLSGFEKTVSAGGVIFLNAVGTGVFSVSTVSAQPTISHPTYIISNGEERVKLTLGHKINITDGETYLSGLALKKSSSTPSYYFTISGGTNGSPKFLMDDCQVDMAYKNLIYAGDDTHGIKDIEITNSVFPVSVASVELVKLKQTHSNADQFEKFTFTGNLMYSTTVANLMSSAFSYSPSAANGTGNAFSATVSNNLFYNVASSGIVKHNTMGSATATKNLQWVTNGTTMTTNAKIFGMKYSTAIPTSAVTDNVAYGSLVCTTKTVGWVAADNAVMGTDMQQVQTLTTDPLDASSDPTNGVFVLGSAYTSYGPQPMPRITTWQ